ncbi:uncharacterized protein LOC111907473 isoform X2 [Lactuca sativa]|uniref:uncharacterized protein LOC111907473 isoform X2 n=1 Tax=Lactuca sativa TaxID=4236 RepID=UPI000CD93E99|nr:uncharacterized protein LOC111907473 isoform X2 [Lactuca sativa]
MDDWVRITVRIRVRWTRWTVGLTRRRRNLRTSLMLTGVLLICILEEVILGDGIAREVHLTIKWASGFPRQVVHGFAALHEHQCYLQTGYHDYKATKTHLFSHMVNALARLFTISSTFAGCSTGKIETTTVCSSDSALANDSSSKLVRLLMVGSM